MLSRREILAGAAIFGMAELLEPMKNVLAKASQPGTPVNFELPKLACDCHVHIFGDVRRFPFAGTRSYTPEPASVEELRALHRALRIDRTVIIQPSVYGTDNSCTLDAIKQCGQGARGIAVIGDNTPASMLDQMHRAGVRGVRINMGTTGQTDIAVARRQFQSALNQINGCDWHVQIYAALSVVAGLSDQVAASPVPVVFDHFGGAHAALGVEQAGFSELLKLVRNGKAYVKISGAYRASTQSADYPDVAPLAKALIAANPQRILWGTDWPHTNTIPGREPTAITPLLSIDDGRLLNLLAVWAPDANTRKAILLDNPARLYGF